MTMLILAEVLIVLLVVAVLVCLTIIQQLKKELQRERDEKNQPYLIFSFEGPNEIFSVKNVGLTPVNMIVIADFNLTLHLDFQKSVTLQFEPVSMLGPREAEPLKFRILDNGYPMPAEARNSFLPHLKAASFEAHIAYRDWQNRPSQMVVVKDKDRFFAKKDIQVPHQSKEQV